jgi:hypothetical protein
MAVSPTPPHGPTAGPLETAPLGPPGDVTVAPPPGPTAAPLETAPLGPLQDFDGLIFSDLVAGKTWLVANGQPALLYPQPFARLAPHDFLVLLEKDGDLWTAKPPQGEPLNLTQTTDRLEGSASWWPANPEIIIFFSAEAGEGFGLSMGQLSRINRDGSGYQVLEEISSAGEAALSPNGSTIAYDAAGKPRLYHLDRGAEPFDLAAYGLPVPGDLKAGGPAWSPDGRRLAWWVSGSADAASNPTTAIAVVDLEARTTSLVHPYQPVGVGGWPPPPVWSPDGEWLAFVTLSEGSKAKLWVARLDGSEQHDLGDSANPVWNPDSGQLIYTQWDPQGGDFTRATTMLVGVGTWQPQAVDLPPGAQPIEWRAP